MVACDALEQGHHKAGGPPARQIHQENTYEGTSPFPGMHSDNLKICWK